MRYILIDRLLELEPGVRVVAERCFSPADEIFADHFPGLPIVPGALLTESMGQTAGWLIAATLDFGRWPLLTMIHAAKFRSRVAPGELVRIEATLRAARRNDFEVEATVGVANRRVASARLAFHTFGPDEMPVDGDLADWTRRTFLALGGDALLPAGSDTRTAS